MKLFLISILLNINLSALSFTCEKFGLLCIIPDFAIRSTSNWLSVSYFKTQAIIAEKTINARTSKNNLSSFTI